MGRKVFYVLIVALFLYTAWPLIIPLAMGGVFAVLFFPFLERLERKKFTTSSAAALLTIGITLVVLVPVGVLIFFAAKTGVQELRHLKEAPITPPGAGASVVDSFLASPRLQELFGGISSWLPIEVNDLAAAAREITHGVVNKVGEVLAALLAGLPSAAMSLAVIVVSIYFFLVDGRKLMLFIRRNSVFPERQTERLVHSFAGMCRSVILATVVSGLAQAVIEMIFVAGTATPNVALIGLLVFAASFLPLVGSFPITAGVALIQLLDGRTPAAIALFVGVVLVAVIDNFIRPAVLKGTGGLHPLLAFVAAFGGLQMMGFPGVFLGPIIAGLFVVTIQILTEGTSGAAPPADIR